jgi:hypothetical protein
MEKNWSGSLVGCSGAGGARDCGGLAAEVWRQCRAEKKQRGEIRAREKT